MPLDVDRERDSGAGRAVDRHILSRFDGDLGHFRAIVLEMGRRVESQVALAGEALAACDVIRARRVIHEHRQVRDGWGAGGERAPVAIQPVARDLRFVLTLSRAVYDLERIGGEAVRVADIAERLYEYQPSVRECVIFEDVRRIAAPAVSLLGRSIKAIADENVQLAVEVALEGKDLNDLFEG